MNKQNKHTRHSTGEPVPYIRIIKPYGALFEISEMKADRKDEIIGAIRQGNWFPLVRAVIGWHLTQRRDVSVRRIWISSGAWGMASFSLLQELNSTPTLINTVLSLSIDCFCIEYSVDSFIFIPQSFKHLNFSSQLISWINPPGVLCSRSSPYSPSSSATTVDARTHSIQR